MTVPRYPDTERIKNFVKLAIEEDAGDGDHTSLSTIAPGTLGKARLIIKEDGILAGVEAARQVFQCIDPALELDVKLKDGAVISKADLGFTVAGSIHSILLAERLVLNIMQRMSGIATETNRLSSMISDLPARLLDTRKTTPGFRYFEKWAVHIGGGLNHRFGLYDMILIKDNHIDIAGSITAALKQAQQYVTDNGLSIRIEIETRSVDEVKEAMNTGIADRIMLDNFEPARLREAVLLINGAAETEASGGITASNLRAYAETGVDFISMGALTHQVKSLDLSLKVF